MSGKPAPSQRILSMSVAPWLLELVASTARADGPITPSYVPRPERTN